SVNVVAGSHKSTVNAFDEMDDNDMPHYVPENVLKEMIMGYDFARYYNINSPAMEFASRAINGEPFTLDHIQRLKSFHDNLEVDMAVREQPTQSWIEYQIAGGSYGYHWIDQVMGAYESQMRRYKSKEDKPRVPSLSASVEAIRGLDLQHYFKRGGTDASIALARKIANRKELTEDEIRTMHSYLQRHTGDQKEGWANPANPSTAYINWQLHGGDAGLSWSSGEIDSMKLKREKLSTVFKEKLTPDERAKLRSSDFVLPGERKFPVTTAEGVKDAISSWGRYRGATTFEQFKRNLIALAKRKGFASALPKEWTSERKKESDINFSPPAGVRSAAKRGLELRSKFNRGGTAVGIARARDLSNGKSVSPQTIRRMHSFFARHAVDKRPGWSNPSKPSNGYIAHLLWGGDAGRAWAAKVDRQLDSRERKKSFEATYKHLRGRHNQLEHSPTGQPAQNFGGGTGFSNSMRRMGPLSGGGGFRRERVMRDKPWNRQDISKPPMLTSGRREAMRDSIPVGGKRSLSGTPTSLGSMARNNRSRNVGRGESSDRIPTRAERIRARNAAYNAMSPEQRRNYANELYSANDSTLRDNERMRAEMAAGLRPMNAPRGRDRRQNSKLGGLAQMTRDNKLENRGSMIMPGRSDGPGSYGAPGRSDGPSSYDMPSAPGGNAMILRD
ncbi:MAG: hypothetical protein ACO3DK_07260, partial [Bacteroidia bacterium]